MATRWGKSGAVTDFLLLGSKITVNSDCSLEIKRHLLLWRKARTNLDRVLKSRDTTLPTKVCIVKATVFPVVMYGWDLNIKKVEWQRIDALKLWCSLDSKEIKPVNLKGNQPRIITERTDVEAKAQILWPHDENSQLTGKDHDARKDWRQKEKRVTEDEMAGWHHQCNGNELGQIPGDGEGQGSLGHCKVGHN